jgi:hypothetical protein
MNKKIILLSLLLMNLKMMCSEIKVIPKAVPCFEISYSDTKVNELSQPSIKHSKYGFESKPLTLTYNEKHERGVISLNGKILERLKIPKQQLPDVAAQIKDNLSINQMESNKDYTLKFPLYVTIKKHNQFIFYKISGFKYIKHSEVDEAGYNSGLETGKKVF